MENEKIEYTHPNVKYFVIIYVILSTLHLCGNFFPDQYYDSTLSEMLRGTVIFGGLGLLILLVVRAFYKPLPDDKRYIVLGIIAVFLFIGLDFIFFFAYEMWHNFLDDLDLKVNIPSYKF